MGSVENVRGAMSDAQFYEYCKIVKDCFCFSALDKVIRTAMVDHYDDKKFNEMACFLRDPAIEMVGQLEEGSKSDETVKERQDFFSGLHLSPPSDVRKRLIERMDRVRHSSLIVIDTQIELLQSMTWGMRSLSEGGRGMTEFQLQQMALEMRAEIGPKIERQIWMSMLYAYKDLSDVDLEKYILLYETSAGEITTDFMKRMYLNMHSRMANELQCALDVKFG